MTRRQNLFHGFLSLILLFSACSSNSEQAVQFSEEGLIPEAFIPQDVGVVVSYSTQSDAQFTAVQALEGTLGDTDRVSRTASEALDAKLGDVGLDFERDLKPALGEQFRMVYAVRPTEEDPENFVVITLEEPAKMEAVLQTLTEADQLSYKKLSDLEAYTKEDSQLTLTIHKDLLLVASTGEQLVGMIEQDEDESLWKSDLYKETVDEVGADYVLYGVMFPSLYAEDLDLPGFSVSNVPAVVDRQVVVVRAEEKGLRFDAWVKANKEKAKETDISFDIVPKSEPYLFEEIPAEGLLAYFESYGLEQTFTQAKALGDDPASFDKIDTFTKNYFAMGVEELFSFMDKAYAFAVHDNGSGLLPGITLYIDASSNVEQAKAFMNKLDGQLSGLLLMAEQMIPGAVTKDTVDFDGEDFSRIKIDLTSLQSAGSPVPSALTSQAIELMYGIRNDRLILSTLGGWDSEGETIAESSLYKDLDGQLVEQNEGLILMDAHGLARFVTSLRDLSGESAEEMVQVEDFLEGFLGVIAQSNTEKYESHFGGFLMLAD